MAQQIKFFRKNYIDQSYSNITLTVTDATASDTGSSILTYLQNRKNTSAWLTTGSADAANTQLDIDWGTSLDLDTLILVKHNFDAYTIQYWNGSAYVDFSTAINESSLTPTTQNDPPASPSVGDKYIVGTGTGAWASQDGKYTEWNGTSWDFYDTSRLEKTAIHSFTTVATQKIRIIITGTMVADDDKILRQLICTKAIGQLNAWPIVRTPLISRNKKTTRALSGKVYLAESIKSFSCTLEVESLKNADDMAIFEELFEKYEGVLIWLCGGDESQYSSMREGYRLEDIYLVRPVSEYSPEWFLGLYQAGVQFLVNLEESII
jgi:hypothetical protein